jgi:hypothetical protein
MRMSLVHIGRVLRINTALHKINSRLHSFPAAPVSNNMGPFSPVAKLFSSVYMFSWDTLLVLGNLVLPKRAAGLIVPDGHPGFGGKWPEHIPPKEGDSRCSCPALNALANHSEHSMLCGKHVPSRLTSWCRYYCARWAQYLFC